MTDRRAVSTTLSYVLSLAIATVLITGLIIAGGSYVDSERKNVIRDELTVIGQQFASDIERADRLVRAGDSRSNMNVHVNQSFSDTVTGTPYEITLDASQSELILNTSRPEVTVRVGITNGTDLGESTVLGGDLQIRYNETGRHLEVRNV